jgi:hypothetical protein
MIKKKGEMSFSFFLSLFGFLIVIVLLLVGFNLLFVNDKVKNNNLSDSNSFITGEVISGKIVYNGQELSVSEIEKGISLSSGWNYFVWPNNQNNPIEIKEAFGSILEKTHFVYDYNNGRYWFNPNGIYSTYNSHSTYSTLLFNEVKPGIKYGVYIAEDLTLRYNFNENITVLSSNDNNVTYLGVLEMLNSCKVREFSLENNLNNFTVNGNLICESIKEKCIFGIFSMNNSKISSCDTELTPSNEAYAYCCKV